jgi:hypothetical protein
LVKTRWKALAGGALTLALALPATASAALYEGKVKGAPGSVMDVRIVKDDGRRFVESLDYSVPAQCDNGLNAVAGTRNFFTGNRVRKGEFDVRQDLAPGEFARLTGELRRGGRKVVGTYRLVTTFPPPTGECRTGKLEWKAEK